MSLLHCRCIRSVCLRCRLRGEICANLCISVHAVHQVLKVFVFGTAQAKLFLPRNPDTIIYLIAGLIWDGNRTLTKLFYSGPQMMVPLVLRDKSVYCRRHFPSLSILWKCLRLGRGCSMLQVSLAHCLHPPQRRNRSGARWEEHRTMPHSDYQRRWLCLSAGKKSPTVQLVKQVKVVGYSRITWKQGKWQK